MKYYSTFFFVLLSFFAVAQSDSSKSAVYLTRITMDVSEIQDPLLFASAIDISLKPSKVNEKYATHSLIGSMEMGDVRTVQMDLVAKKMAKSAITSSLINFTFRTRSVDDFIGVFNFIFEFSDGSNYPYRLGRIAIGNDLKLNSISRTIYIR
jgi:putative N-acetylmannosamine-6-phosphate epimerase